MEQYNYLQKKKTKALKVFKEAHASLNAVNFEIQGALDARKKSIEDHHAAISRDEDEAAYLKQELAKNMETTSKIAAIIA